MNDALGKYEVTEGFPRPYIRIEEDASGNANITNSEIAYLGYEACIENNKAYGNARIGISSTLNETHSNRLTIATF